MKIIEIGKNIKQIGGFEAFIPNSFPPKEELSFNAKTLMKYSQAIRLLGKLDGITKLLPDVDFFIMMYKWKDATDSSQIEGTRATMVDAIEAEANVNVNVPEDTGDILHYLDALNYGLERLTKDAFPISLRFFRELHKKLMDNARANHFSDPGEFRKSQNWIGGTRPDNARFVPPPVEDMHRALADLERFIHADDSVLPLIKAGLIHAQFEVIHPFLDGNGRTGRMLITFYLWKENLLEKPVLFLSSFFKKHQNLYYEKLSAYHNGRIEEWIEFFLEGVVETAEEAIMIATEIAVLRDNNLTKIQQFGKRASESALVVLPKLYAQPIINVKLVTLWTGFTREGAQRIVNRLVEIGILVPKNKDKKYGQSYVYKDYIDIFLGKKL